MHEHGLFHVTSTLQSQYMSREYQQNALGQHVWIGTSTIQGKLRGGWKAGISQCETCNLVQWDSRAPQRRVTARDRGRCFPRMPV
jgi:hypothetical protein